MRGWRRSTHSRRACATSARACSEARRVFFIGKASRAKKAGERGWTDPYAALRLKFGGEFRHRNVRALFHTSDKKGPVRLQLAAAGWPPLPGRFERSGPPPTRHQLHRATRAQLELARSSATGLPFYNQTDDALTQVRCIALAHDPPPSTVNHNSAKKGIPCDSDLGRDALSAR
jgi:hypothetical protein